MIDNIIKIKNLRKTYSNGFEALKGIDINIKRGKIFGLLGPNGAGKTTTFYMITGMINPSSGGVYLDDNNITNMPMYKRAQIGIGYLSQESSVFTKLSVEDNLKLVLQMTTLNPTEQTEKLESLLIEFSMQHIRKSIAMTLSGGERRRTEIARSLVMDPDFILLDEPFAGIDPIAVEEIQKIIHRLNKDLPVLVIFIKSINSFGLCFEYL